MPPSPLDTRRLLYESAPVAGILFFWLFFTRFVHPVIAAGLFYGGIGMALLYTIVRGVALASSLPATSPPDDLQGIIQENVQVALPAGVWFLGAVLIYEIEMFWDSFGLPGLATSPAGIITLVMTGTGVGVVLLYAIAVGVPRVRGGGATSGSSGSSAASLDD